jgi:hypothetical protein
MASPRRWGVKVLDLQTCKKCLRIYTYRSVDFEATLRRRRIICPYIMTSNLEETPIDGDPPEKCPFKLEHGVVEAIRSKRRAKQGSMQKVQNRYVGSP